MPEQQGAAYGLGVSMGILAYHAIAGNVLDARHAIDSATGAAHRVLNSGLAINMGGLESVSGPGGIRGTIRDWCQWYDVGTGDLGDFQETLSATVGPLVNNLSGEYQGESQAASPDSGRAYALGLAISIAEAQATAGEAARSIVFDSLGNAESPAQALGLDSSALETIRTAVSQGDGLEDAYQRITALRGLYQSQINAAPDFEMIDVVAAAAAHAATPPPAAPSVPTQDDWRYCKKCAGLVYAGGSVGVCPEGGTHDTGGSWDYSLVYGGGQAGQDNWRYCSKCTGLFFAGHSNGVCKAGGAHDGTNSWDYVLTGDGPGQSQWRWCKRCQGLYFAGGNVKGVCPAGDGHDGSGSGGAGYTLSH